MRWLRIARARVRAWFRRDAVADEIREELEFHLERRANDYTREGVSPQDAHRLASRRLGNLALLQDQAYDLRGGGIVESIAQDVRYGIRSLRQSRTFTFVALSVLSLSIGAGTTVYSVVDAAALRPLPFSESHRLVAVLGVDAPKATFPTRGWTTPSTYLDWRRMQHSFDAIAMAGRTSFRLKTRGGEPADARAEQITWELFSILRTRPRLGRLFTADDEVEGRDRVVILSDRFWRREFNGSADVIGKRLEMNEQAWQIVGVMSPEFEYPVAEVQPADLYVPLAFRASDHARSAGRSYNWIVIGRLENDVSLQQADADIKRIAKTLDAQFPEWEPGRSARVVSLQDYVVGDARQWLMMLLGAIGFVLLIASANVANLMLARTAVRRRELAVRAALGAGRARIARAVLIEGLLLSSTAAAIGAAFAFGGVAVTRMWLPASVPRAAAIAVDGRVLAVELAAAFLVALAFGLVPACQSARVTLVEALKAGGRGMTSTGLSGRLRSTLLVLEVAIAVTLLAGAGLFIVSFRNLMAIDLGFDYRNVISMSVGLRFDPANRQDSRWTWHPSDSPAARRDRAAQYFGDLRAAIGRIPGIRMVALNDGGLPIEGSWSSRRVASPGANRQSGERAEIDRLRVTPNYFPLLRIPLQRGRLLSETDRAGTPLVAVVNDFAARKYWPGLDPLGRHVVLDAGGDDGTAGSLDFEVIGIVGNTRHEGPEEPPRPQMYVSFAQDAGTFARLVIKTDADAARLLPAVKAAVWSVNPDQHLTQPVYTLEGHLDRIIAPRRFNMSILVFFGAIGLAIAAAGIFGVMAYAVTQRTNEIAVRVSLGATTRHITSMVLREASILVALGIGIGAVAAWNLAGIVESLLFLVKARDLPVFAWALTAMAVVGLAAAVVPARRAASVDPLISLRDS